MDVKLKRRKITLSVPVAEPRKGAYQTRHVDVRLNGKQALGLRRLFDGLHNGSFKLKQGKHIDTASDVIRYLLEQVDAEASKVMPGRNGG